MAPSRPSATAPGGGRQAASILFVSRNRFETAVLGCWVLTLVVISLHAGINPGAHSVFIDYWNAGARWIRGEYLYPHRNQFLYSPLAAAWFAPFALLPQALGGILWRLLSAIALILGARMTQNESDVARLMLGFTDGIVSPVSDRPRWRKASRVDPVRF